MFTPTLDYIMIVGAVIVIALLMNRFHEVKERRERLNSPKQLHQYILNDMTLGKNKKPMLWIYVPYE